MKEILTKEDFVKALGSDREGTFELDNLRILRALYKQFKADSSIISADFLERFSQRLTTLTRVSAGLDSETGKLFIIARGKVSVVDMERVDEILNGETT